MGSRTVPKGQIDEIGGFDGQQPTLKAIAERMEGLGELADQSRGFYGERNRNQRKYNHLWLQYIIGFHNPFGCALINENVRKIDVGEIE